MSSTVKLLLLIVYAAAFFTGCIQTTNVILEDQPDTAPYYTSGYPVVDVSLQIEKIQESIIRISSTGRYRMFYVHEDLQLTADQVNAMDLDSITTRGRIIEESTAGSATVIAKGHSRAYLLTCAHTVEFPDRMINYRVGENIPPNTYVGSVALKQNQVNVAITGSSLAFYTLVDEDREKDLALISLELEGLPEDELQPLNIQIGSSEYLRGGSFIYVLGYPKGFKSVTRGIVSLANRNQNADYLTDALFNRGVSGGIILASNNNYKSFEWVGIASAGAASRDYFLVPEVNSIDYDEKLQHYTGLIMAREVSTLDYGITHAISTKSINEFLSRNSNRIRNLNRDLNSTPYGQ